MSLGGFGAMRERAVLITNNPNLRRWVFPESSIDGKRGHNVSVPAGSVMMVDGSSLDVLVSVRDAVHLGSRLLTHPLCGNLRPYQQPFRSVLIKKEENMNCLVDLESLSMIEEAVLVYRGCDAVLPLPHNLPDALREDYAFVDAELMRESLERYGLLQKC